jgi:hypothetical protein
MNQVNSNNIKFSEEDFQKLVRYISILIDIDRKAKKISFEITHHF